jgi:class 3 adenylate cyclase
VDVAAWLRDLGLEQYAGTFRDNAIDGDVLPELTEEHLRELGLPLGHRLKLLRAIAVLRRPSDTNAFRAPEADAPNAIPAHSDLAPSPAERRQLTLMFVDLVDSTALSARLDPEEMGQLLKAYSAAVTREVARFEGYVAKLMGDGILAYFGWPMAHEDDAERATRAGLAVVQAVGAIRVPGGGALACRAGIATGLVVVGDLIGEGTAQERAVIGETPNLAARLQELAPPGAVVIGTGAGVSGTLRESTRGSVRGAARRQRDAARWP